MRSPAPPVALLTVFAVSFGFAPATARADTRGMVDVSLGARASTNPYLTAEDEAATASASLTIDPNLTWQGETTTASLDGHFRLEQFTNRYGTDVSVRAVAAAQTRVTERTSVTGAVSARSRRAAQDVIDLTTGQISEPPEIVPDVDIPDFTVAGSGARTSDYSAQVGLQHVSSERETISVGLNGGTRSTDSSAGNDYTRLGAQVSYTNRVSERASVRASLQASRADYKDRTVGDGTYATPLIGVDYRLSQTISLTALAGATFTSVRSGPSEREQHLDFALSLNLCQRGESRLLCATASRDTQPTTFGGLRTTSTVGATYNTRAGLRGRLTLNGRYGRTSNILGDQLNSASDFEVVGASGTYSHEINQRLFGYVSSGVTHTSRSHLTASRTSAQVEIGIRHRFGDAR